VLACKSELQKLDRLWYLSYLLHKIGVVAMPVQEERKIGTNLSLGGRTYREKFQNPGNQIDD